MTDGITSKIAILGECMIELSVKESAPKIAFGGDTLNTAVYLSRLLRTTNAEVHYVTALGRDPFSEQMLANWQQEGIRTELVQQLPDKLPGLYSIVTDKQGERSFYYWRNDSAARYWLNTADSDSIVQQLLNFDYLYLSGISVAILDSASRENLYHLLADFKQHGGKIIFDNNYRSILWDSPETARLAYQRVLSLTDITFLTLDDEIALWQQENDFSEQQQSAVDAVITRSQRYGVAEIVIKRGSESCLVIQGESRSEIAANKIAVDKIIDTTAAGDSFSAGYLAARLQAGSLTVAAEQGHKLAGMVIQHRGAIIPAEKMPN